MLIGYSPNMVKINTIDSEQDIASLRLENAQEIFHDDLYKVNLGLLMSHCRYLYNSLSLIKNELFSLWVCG